MLFDENEYEEIGCEYINLNFSKKFLKNKNFQKCIEYISNHITTSKNMSILDMNNKVFFLLFLIKFYENNNK